MKSKHACASRIGNLDRLFGGCPRIRNYFKQPHGPRDGAHAASTLEHTARIDPLLEPFAEIGHRTRVAASDPFAQPFGVLGRGGGRDACQIEAEGERRILDGARELPGRAQ